VAENQVSFFVHLFRRYFSQNRFIEPPAYPQDLRIVISILRRALNLTPQQLSKHIPDIMPSYLQGWEYKGGPINVAQCEALSDFCRELDLPIMATWFYTQSLLVKRSPRGAMRILLGKGL
jgi:hypothetical protein